MADNSTVSYPMGRLFTGIPTGDAPTKPVMARAVPAEQRTAAQEVEEPKRDAPKPEAKNVAGRRVYGEYDGYVKISFGAGKSYDHVFAFYLPNVIGNLGVAGINDAAITEMIERALVDKLGRGGVVRHKTES